MKVQFRVSLDGNRSMHPELTMTSALELYTDDTKPITVRATLLCHDHRPPFRNSTMLITIYMLNVGPNKCSFMCSLPFWSPRHKPPGLTQTINGAKDSTQSPAALRSNSPRSTDHM